MKKPTREEVLANPIVETLNPRTHDFVRVHQLSRLNRFKHIDDIDIGAAHAFHGFPHVKAVAAFGMLMQDFEHGIYDDIDTLVVPSSGNTAHAVALLAPAFGVRRVVVVMPSDAPEAKMSVIKMIPWARLITPEGVTKVEDLALEEASKPRTLLLDQYKHSGNTSIHEECTGPQLLRAAGENLGLVAIGMGSGGTIAGVSRYLKRLRPDILVIGVRPKFGQRVPGTRDELMAKAVIDEEAIPYRAALDGIYEVGREESFVSARELMVEVYPPFGPSSGLARAGLELCLKTSSEIRKALRGKQAVFVCPDDGRFYPGPTFGELDPDQGLVQS